MAGLRAIELRPRTGSLVIEYDPTACTEGALLAALGRRPADGSHDEPGSPPHRRPLHLVPTGPQGSATDPS